MRQNPVGALETPQLSRRHFDEIRALTYRICGIDLQPGKESLVQSRLGKRLRRLGLPDFDAYIAHVREDATGSELSEMIDALTTNKTSFFREERHFEFIARQVVAPALVGSRRIRLWSAGCSSGEEPYTLAMVCLAAAGATKLDLRVLATDLSMRVLTKATAGMYERGDLEGVSPQLLRQYFLQTPTGGWQVSETLRSLVRFARLNLMDEWPMRGPFDVILCRNVMIYFDKQTQERLVDRFTSLLSPGGHLIVGHSESLSGMRQSLRYVQPAVYAK